VNGCDCGRREESLGPVIDDALSRDRQRAMANERRPLLEEAARRANAYLDGIGHRRVGPTSSALERLPELGGALPENPSPAVETIRLLDEIGSPATMASAGGRCFGFVIGGALPVTVASNWLATAWDQNAALWAASPVAAYLEEVALEWIADILRLPRGTGGAFVTGASMASFAALAAARHALLERSGWDVAEQGMAGSPALRVVVSEEIHVTVVKTLSLLGFGRASLEFVPVDSQGRILADRLPSLDERTIVCVQAGDVNSGCIDPMESICGAARDVGAWVHVDGAFGLWAAAVPSLANLVAGVELADSWSTDGHKWLNTPYDNGIALIREPRHLRSAMSAGAAYLLTSTHREPRHHSPELSRRARGVDIWAALRSLGRVGVAEMVERTCVIAARISHGLREIGLEVLNEVLLNQVLVAAADDETTHRLAERIQEDGVCWCGTTTWRGRRAVRVSVSSWATTEEDADLTIGAFLAALRAIGNVK
jgi:glutamate/tyrosine decarboxylase-like PLP-dependent enzyme